MNDNILAYLVRTPEEHRSELYLVSGPFDGDSYEAMNVNPESPDFGKNTTWDVRDSTPDNECFNKSTRLAAYSDKDFKDRFAGPFSAKEEIKRVLFDSLITEENYGPALKFMNEFEARNEVEEVLYRLLMRTVGKHEED